MIFVDSPQIVDITEDSIVSSKFRSPNNEIDRVWYKTTAPINLTSDIFLASTLIPAMKLGENLTIAGAVSEKLYNNIPQIQNILSGWYPELKKINVNAQYIKKENQSVKDTACFFSAGVDSFHTLLKHKDEITKIIYVRGFDVGLYEREYMDMMSMRIRKIADALGKELIEVETNIHVFGDKYVDWLCHYHGSAIASVAILLSNTISKIYIPSNYGYGQSKNIGTHTILDGLWSTEKIEIIHDQCVSRIDKVKEIMHNQIALDNLRVCSDRSSGKYNCSRCEKCFRTMIAFYAYGMLDKCKTFSEMDISVIPEIKMSEFTVVFHEENYNALPEGEVKQALKIAIDNFKNE